MTHQFMFFEPSGRVDTDILRSVTQPAVQRCQGQAAPEGNLQIGRIVDRQSELPREIEDSRFVMLDICGDSQRKTVSKGIGHLPAL